MPFIYVYLKLTFQRVLLSFSIKPFILYYKIYKDFVGRILKKFRMFGYKIINMPLVVNEKLMKDGGKKVDNTFYRSLIGNTAIRLDVIFIASLLSRFMNSPVTFILELLKRCLNSRHYVVWN